MNGIKAAALGRLGRDPEKRYLPTGMAVTTFTIAVEDLRKAEDAPTEWLKVSVWDTRAEELVPSDGDPLLSKGDTVYVEGRLRLSRWETNGQPRSGIELSATTVTPIGTFRKNAWGPNPNAPSAEDRAHADLEDAATRIPLKADGQPVSRYHRGRGKPAPWKRPQW